MKNSDNQFWPYKRRTSTPAAIVILLGLLFIVAILKEKIQWPADKNDTSVLIGVLIFSLLPVVLALVDAIFERGGVFQFGNLKIDFSQVSKLGMASKTIPVNIGLKSTPVDDNSHKQIFEALEQASSCDVAIIDLEDGHAWWETRLLVLLTGAERRKKPGKIVFVGANAGKKQCFLGWSHPYELLPLMNKSNPQYSLIYQKTMAAVRQWALVEPNLKNLIPAKLPFPETGLAGAHADMVFDKTGLPKVLFAEQLLATILGDEIESQQPPKKLSIPRLRELFKPVLYDKDSVDENDSPEDQMRAFFKSSADYIAITNNGKYSTIVSRLTVLSTILKTMVEQK